MPIKRLELIYTGRFDRTTFREQAADFAAAHGLTGYADKISADRIKVVVEGEESGAIDFMRDLNEYVNDFVEHYTKRWLDPSGEYNTFRLMKP